jgi:hypothetical protein
VVTNEQVLVKDNTIFGERDLQAIKAYINHPSHRTAAQLPQHVNKIAKPRDSTEQLTIDQMWPTSEAEKTTEEGEEVCEDSNKWCIVS